MTITVGELVSFGPQARGEQKKVSAMKLCTLVNRSLCPTGNFREFCRNIYFIPTSKPRGILQSSGAEIPCWPETSPRQAHISILLSGHAWQGLSQPQIPPQSRRALNPARSPVTKPRAESTLGGHKEGTPQHQWG